MINRKFKQSFENLSILFSRSGFKLALIVSVGDTEVCDSKKINLKSLINRINALLSLTEYSDRFRLKALNCIEV